MKKFLTLALLLAFVQTQTGAVALAAGKATKGVQATGDVRAQVDRAGLGEKARVTVRLKDGTRRKGYVAERRESDFVLRDRKTDAPTAIAYNDVERVEINRGHSTARNTALGVGVGAGAVLVTLALLIASIDD
jgi:hypothetical protein